MHNPVEEARARRRAFNLPRIAGYGFISFGVFICGIGGLVAIDDPAGFFAILFGLAFVGAGFLCLKLAVPAGKKEVAVSGHTAGITRWDGRSGTRSQTTVIHVDEHATPADTDAARAAWLRQQWSLRADWSRGVIRCEDARYGSLAFWAAGLWVIFALGALGAALVWGGFAWLVAAGASVLAIAFTVNAIHLALRRRKFGGSSLTLAAAPVAAGSLLEGEVQTGVPRNMPVPDGFKLSLRCVHRWEEQTGTGDNRRTHMRRDVLWETQSTRAGRNRLGSPTLVVDVSLGLPADLPSASIDHGSEGILWELSVTASLPGIDYEAVFELPVFDAKTAELLRSAA